MSQRYIGGLIYNPPGGFSGYFDGSGDRLVVAGNAAFNFGTGDFTVECWFYTNSVSANQWIVGPDNTVTYPWALQTLGTAVRFISNNAANDFRPTGFTLATGVWNHFAVTRSGSTMYWFVNGVLSGTQTYSTSIGSNTIDVQIGTTGSGSGDPVNGYISNLRVVKGTAVYTASFNPPTGQLQAITNTSLLTCAYPTFRDGSSNNFTITVNGNTAVSTQNPFPQTQLPNPALGNQGNGVYSMSQYQALRSQNLWPAIDPYFDYVTLMLHGNGTNGAQNNTFLDSSTNNFTITRNGNTTQGTFTPYGSNWSNYFGATGQYLSVAYSSAFNLTGDFTIECWINPGNLPSSIGSAAQSYERVFSFGTYNAANSLGLEINSNDSGNLRRFVSWYNGTSYGLGSNNAVAPGNWYHIAMVRSGTTITLYLNGTSIGTITGASAAVNTSQAFYIASLQGFEGDASAAFNGYISNFRIVKSAVYTSNFTPSASPLTAITNTVLLTCQDNRFRDNSTNNATVSVAGSPSVQRFSPFNPTTPYAAGTIGGSGYFDGSGDYLTTASNAAMAVGTGDFTLECWVYATATPSDVGIYEGRDAASSNGITLTALDATTIRIFSGSALVTASGVNYIGTWCHLAVTRVSGTTTLYINGVSAGTSATSYNGTRNTAVIGAGVYSSSPTPNKFFPGYISNFRLVKGTAVYTGNFTPPASPVAAVTNTSLLLNFTNGGIIDNAMMSDFETVGNTQVSTTQFKFGGSSIYFDGSGDYLFTPISPNLNMGTSDWTIEMWVYISSRTTNFPLVFGNNRGVYTTDAVALTTSNADSASYNDKFVFAWNNGGFSSPSAGTSQLLVANVTNATATWYHFAVVRNGTSIRMYRNGTEIASATISAASTFNWGFNGTLLGGGNWDGAQSEFNGYLDDVRVTRGYARYTGNFTPQRSQWQDQ